MSLKYRIPRKTFLKGVGVSMALPNLEIMTPLKASSTSKRPLRLGVFHKGNGIDPESWHAEGTENDFTLSKNLTPLEGYKSDIVVLSNVSNQAKGDHYAAMPLFMTGQQTRNPGQSFDQIIAEKIGQLTQFPSFQLCADPVDVRSTTLNALAYDKDGRPLPIERNAQFAFDRLFRGLGDPGVRNQMSSVLDAVLEPTNALMKRASSLDKTVLNDYLDAVRDVELAIEKQENRGLPRPNLDKVNTDVIQLEDFPAKMKTLSDLVALAFWTDATRVATCIMALESSRRIHDFIGLKADFHWSSHFQRNAKLAEQFNAANTWYVSQFGKAIDAMKALKEVDGSTVFDNTILLFGSGLGHGGHHYANNLPLVLAGGKNSGLNTGKLLHYDKQPPYANCLLTLIQHFGVEMEQYTKSTGTLDKLCKS